MADSWNNWVTENIPYIRKQLLLIWDKACFVQKKESELEDRLAIDEQKEQTEQAMLQAQIDELSKKVEILMTGQADFAAQQAAVDATMDACATLLGQTVTLLTGLGSLIIGLQTTVTNLQSQATEGTQADAVFEAAAVDLGTHKATLQTALDNAQAALNTASSFVPPAPQTDPNAPANQNQSST